MYLFVNRYCRITAYITARPDRFQKPVRSGPGEHAGQVTTLTGWITQADAFGILLMDEDNNEHYVKKEELAGDVVVVLEQKERGRTECMLEVAEMNFVSQSY